MIARHHSTKSTISAAFHCKKCKKETQHRIDDGRKGPCLECIARADAEANAKADREAPPLQLCLCLEAARAPRERGRQ